MSTTKLGRVFMWVYLALVALGAAMFAKLILNPPPSHQSLGGLAVFYIPLYASWPWSLLIASSIESYKSLLSLVAGFTVGVTINSFLLYHLGRLIESWWRSRNNVP